MIAPVIIEEDYPKRGATQAAISDLEIKPKYIIDPQDSPKKYKDLNTAQPLLASLHKDNLSRQAMTAQAALAIGQEDSVQHPSIASS